MWKQNVVYAYNGTVFSLKKEGRLGETEQDPVVLAPQCPLLAFCCWKLSRVSLVREMRSAATKENSQRRPYNNTVIEHSQGPSVPPPGLQIIFWAIAWELSCRYYTRWKKGTTWWPDRAQDVSCPIPENRPQWKGTNGPWNWRLTVPKARWCWSDHWWSVWRWLSELTVLWHSSILAWRIPWTEEPGELQSTGSQRVGHDWVTSFTHSLLSYKTSLVI